MTEKKCIFALVIFVKSLIGWKIYKPWLEMTVFKIIVMKKFFVLISLLFPLIGLSQVDIKISIDNQQDDTYYFCKYRGSKALVIDTLTIKNDVIRFKQKTKLPEGIYLLTTSKNIPLIEVLVAKKQKFSVKVSDLEDWSTVKVKGCAKETKIYYKLMAKIRETEANIKVLESEEGYHPENWKKADSLRKDLASYEESMKVKKSSAFINTVINSVKSHQLHNYWDEFPFDDPRVLTYPMIDNKLDAYFEAMSPDAIVINEAIDNIIAKAGSCTEVRDYLLWYFYRMYYAPKYMNLDDVYIHLVNDYFVKLKLEGVSESMLKAMADRAKHLENLKIGAKFPELGNLHSIDASYVAVVFYDKTCEKCAQEGRILEDIRTRHPEMVIFPVEISSGVTDNILSKFDVQNTPMIYLLDPKKVIIAKRIKAGQVEQFLNMDID